MNTEQCGSKILETAKSSIIKRVIATRGVGRINVETWLFFEICGKVYSFSAKTILAKTRNFIEFGTTKFEILSATEAEKRFFELPEISKDESATLQFCGDNKICGRKDTIIGVVFLLLAGRIDDYLSDPRCFSELHFSEDDRSNMRAFSKVCSVFLHKISSSVFSLVE